MKVLFLDIDGVLNSSRTVLAHGAYPHTLRDGDWEKFDWTGILMIQRLCAVADLSVVLSSAWRLDHDFRQVGRVFNLPIIDRTPSFPGTRGMEIKYWLDQHPEVEAFAIVDDDADMLPEQLPHFVQTDGHEGVTFKNYQQLCERFGVNPWDRPPRERNEILNASAPA
ncbi:HAD domain-containing protein [Caldimonas sp. KR1-144]|uniref:HAD domain-containing protein n=1 Tax=Caldimonas sp. KR1-144 TaxID=3400911 RepID=UPI003C00A258